MSARRRKSDEKRPIRKIKKIVGMSTACTSESWAGVEGGKEWGERVSTDR
jgi:hypothetical protein